MVSYMHLSETGDTDRLWVKVVKDFGQRLPHVGQEERIDIFVGRRITFVLQRAHGARPLQRQHDAILEMRNDRAKKGLGFVELTGKPCAVLTL